MPKIPNYTAHHSEHPMNGYRWKNDDKSHIRVEVTKNIGPHDDWDEALWRVEIWNYGKMKELGPISKNKEDMRELAVEWMKDNPDGWKPGPV